MPSRGCRRGFNMNPTTESASKTAPLDPLAINTIRFLSVDAMQQANNGYSGFPLGVRLALQPLQVGN